jgi:DNA-binding NarL/FixJ family response regulator
MPDKKANETIRIVVVDDHMLLLDSLTRLLEDERDFEVVGCAANGEDALRLVTETRPDVAIVDISMPGMNGIEIARKIRETSPATRVLMLSMHSTPAYLHRAFRAGADGYVVKESAGAELVRAVRRVNQGKRYLSEALAESAVGAIKRDPRAMDDPLGSLTARERQILGLVVEGMSSAEAAAAIRLSPKTVETYRSRIMHKLGIKDLPGLVSSPSGTAWHRLTEAAGGERPGPSPAASPASSSRAPWTRSGGCARRTP